jgi:hypothetical protein
MYTTAYNDRRILARALIAVNEKIAKVPHLVMTRDGMRYAGRGKGIMVDHTREDCIELGGRCIFGNDAERSKLMEGDPRIERIIRPLGGRSLGPEIYNPIYEALYKLNDREGERLVAAIVAIIDSYCADVSASHRGLEPQ